MLAFLRLGLRAADAQSAELAKTGGRVADTLTDSGLVDGRVQKVAMDRSTAPYLIVAIYF